MYLVWLQGCGTFLLSYSCNFNLQENISKVVWTLFSYSPTWYCQGVPQSGSWYKQYIIFVYTFSSFSRTFFKRVAWFCSLSIFLSFLNVQNYLHVQFWMYKILFVLGRIFGVKACIIQYDTNKISTTLLAFKCCFSSGHFVFLHYKLKISWIFYLH